MNTSDAMAVVQLAFQHGCPAGMATIAQELDRRGWRRSVVDDADTGLDLQWNFAKPPYHLCVHTAHRGDTFFVGLIANSDSDDGAKVLFTTARSFIEQAAGPPTSRQIPDGSMCHWNNGPRDIWITIHDGSAARSAHPRISPWCQLTVENSNQGR